jgi:hypothetical protein
VLLKVAQAWMCLTRELPPGSSTVIVKVRLESTISFFLDVTPNIGLGTIEVLEAIF